MPSRRCVSCGREGEKSEFLRVVRTPDGAYAIDPTGHADGRGAYLCRNAECLANARRKKSFNRSFHTAIPEEIYRALEDHLG